MTQEPLSRYSFNRPLEDIPNSATRLSLENFNDLPLELSVDLDSCEMTVQEVLNLSVGSVVHFEKHAGETATLTLKHIPLAKAEMFVANDAMQVCIVEVLDEMQQDKAS